MPNLEDSDAVQTAVLFNTAAYDNFGNTTVGEPQEIPVRWTTSRRQALDPKGNTVALSAQVVVYQDIYPGAQMWLGTLAQWNQVSGNPSTVDEELHEVISFSSTPDIKGRNGRRSVNLMRYRDKNQNQ